MELLLYLESANVTKQKGFDKFNLAAKWKRNIGDGARMKVGSF